MEYTHATSCNHSVNPGKRNNAPPVADVSHYEKTDELNQRTVFS